MLGWNHGRPQTLLRGGQKFSREVKNILLAKKQQKNILFLTKKVLKDTSFGRPGGGALRMPVGETHSYSH